MLAQSGNSMCVLCPYVCLLHSAACWRPATASTNRSTGLRVAALEDISEVEVTIKVIKVVISDSDVRD